MFWSQSAPLCPDGKFKIQERMKGQHRWLIVGKESTCNVGDPGLIPGSGRSTGEGIAYPQQYSWASLVAQLVKNLPAIQETWVWPLGWENPLEKGKAAHSSILAWGISWVHGVMTFTFTFQGNSDPITVFLIVWALFSLGRAFPPLAFCLENSL